MKYFFAIFLCIFMLFRQETYANNYLSPGYSTQDKCIEDKQLNDSLYPGYTRSECFDVKEKYYYNICESNYCPTPKQSVKQGSVENAKQIEQLSKVLEEKLESLESQQVVDWSQNFWDILEKLKTKYQNNAKSLELIKDIEKQFDVISQKQISQNTLCEQTYGRWWQEAEEFFETINTVEWYEGEEKYEIACEYYLDKKPKEDPLDSLVDNQENNWWVTQPAFEFRLVSSKVENYLNKIILHFEFNDEIWERNILIRNFSTYEYQEKYLHDFSQGDFKEKTFQFSDVSHNVLWIWFTHNEYYTLEIFDEDNNQILAQYRFKYSDESVQKDIAPSYPIRNIFDGNKQRSENYFQYLQEVSKQDIYDFFKKAEAEIQSKIKESWDFVYFNDNYALTKKMYYWNQIYSSRVCPNNAQMCSNGEEISSICPVWYKLEHDTINYNAYERQLIGYYLNNNKAKYFQHNNPKGVLGNNLIATPVWVWDKFDEYYVRKVDLEKIKKESQTKTFMTREFVFSNPGHSLKRINEYNKYHYWTDYGSSYKVGTKMPALCEKKNGNINTPNDKYLYNKNLSWVLNISKEIIIKDAQREGAQPLMLSYAYLKLQWFFSWDKTYFMPYKDDALSIALRFIAKQN